MKTWKDPENLESHGKLNTVPAAGVEKTAFRGGLKPSPGHSGLINLSL